MNTLNRYFCQVHFQAAVTMHTLMNMQQIFIQITTMVLWFLPLLQLEARCMGIYAL